jgi:galactokinase
MPVSLTRLLSLGFSESDAESRAALLERAIECFRRETRTEPEYMWFVPGRIEVFGKHTDYAGGRSLLAAVPRGFAVVAGPRDDGLVRVIDARYGGDVTVDPLDTTREFTGWTKYVAVTARRLAGNFPGARLGADIAIASDLPRAAGVSSSSALVVGIASALIERAQLAERPDWREAIGTTLDLAGYLGAAENGLTFGALAGTSGVGTHGGSEDHTAILTCRAGRLSMYSYVPVVHRGDELMPAAWRFVVMASGIEADKAGGVLDRYNRASLATRALLDLWNMHSGRPRPTLAAALAAGSDAITELRQIVAERAIRGFDAAELGRRLAHFAAEDERVPLAGLAFRRADATGLGALSAASQGEADRWLGNQVPETRDLAALAREHGAFAASSFGAGFGGSVWALVEAGDAEAFAARWRAAYLARHPKLGPVESFTAMPSPGLTRL